MYSHMWFLSLEGSSSACPMTMSGVTISRVSIPVFLSALGWSTEASGSYQTTGLRAWGPGLRRGDGEAVGVGLCLACTCPEPLPPCFHSSRGTCQAGVFL